MTANEIIEEALKEVEVEYRFNHFETEEAVNPPFICYTNPETRNFYADGKVYMTIQTINIELYTDQKTKEREEKIEAALQKRGIGWRKAEVYIEEENMYEVLYEMEVKEDAGNDEEE